jgi:hypothetical protein
MVIERRNEARFSVASETDAASPRVRDLLARVRAIGEQERDEIRERVPKVMRRVGGYNIDVFEPQSDQPYTPTGASIGRICWSAAKARSLDALAHAEARAASGAPRAWRIVSFPTLHRAMECAQHIVTLRHRRSSSSIAR